MLLLAVVVGSFSGFSQLNLRLLTRSFYFQPNCVTWTVLVLCGSASASFLLERCRLADGIFCGLLLYVLIGKFFVTVQRKVFP